MEFDYNKEGIEDVLPKNWKYEIINKHLYGKDLEKIELTLKVALFTPEEIKLWIESLEEITYCTYSVNRTGNNTGERILFKQFLNCQHNTRSKKIYDPSSKISTKNTNCPSYLNITLKKVNKKFRGKPENAPDPEMPCVIIFVPTHNHSVSSADALKFRRVSENTKQKLIDLFKLGHTPATALKTIKIDIQLSYANYEKLLADRSICPDYNYCYNLFMNEFKNVCGRPVECSDGRNSLDMSESVVNLYEESEEDSYEKREVNSYEEDISVDLYEESAIEECQKLVGEFSECVMNFVNRSPFEMVTVLRKMVEKANSLKTINAFVSSCATFGSAHHGKKFRALSVQPTAFAQTKTHIIGKSKYVRGKSRHNAFKKRTLQKIIKHIKGEEN